mgnify:CR=1 FL=1
MSKIETLWETYDFISNKIVALEDKISHLMDNEGEFKEESFNKDLKKLINAYNKQLLTIREIKCFCKDHPEDISEERQVELDTLEELEDVTEELKLAMTQGIKKRLDN